MKKFVLFLAMLALVFCPQAAEAREHHVPRRTQHYSRPKAGVDKNAAYSDMVIDAETGEIIRTVDGDARRHPASLTKMMTLYLTFQALEAGLLELDRYVSVSEAAARQPPSKLGLRAGRRIRVEDAILGVVTESANDAAVVLAEAMGGTESNFAAMMTRQARSLGMSHTSFQNASGLPDPDQVTSARDMAIMGVALINHYPRYYPYFSRDSFTYAGVYHRNHNRLMDRYDGMDGIKTGYIRASGFNLVSSVKRGDRRLIGVIFGGHSAVSRDNHMAKLLDQSFEIAEERERLQNYSSLRGEGDSDDRDTGNDVVLPAKVAAIFPSKNAVYAHASLPPKPSVSHAGGGTWGVQIGAYSNAECSRKALASLVSSVSGWPSEPEPLVQKISSGGVEMYRARLVSLDRRTAEAVCSYLVEHGKGCMTLEP